MAARHARSVRRRGFHPRAARARPPPPHSALRARNVARRSCSSSPALVGDDAHAVEVGGPRGPDDGPPADAAVGVGPLWGSSARRLAEVPRARHVDAGPVGTRPVPVANDGYVAGDPVAIGAMWT